MDSQFSNAGSLQMMNRFATVDRDGFGQGVGEGFEDEREMDMTANQ